MLEGWLRCKKPELQSDLPNPTNTPNPSEEMKEVWRAWDRLRSERQTVSAQYPDTKEVEDWWLEKEPEKAPGSAEVKKNEGTEEGDHEGKWASDDEDMGVQEDSGDEEGVKIDMERDDENDQGSYGGSNFVFNLPIRERR